MKYEQKEENYIRFSRNPARINGAIHNTVTARKGVGFDNNLGDAVDAVEIAFTAEPHGNIRSMMGCMTKKWVLRFFSFFGSSGKFMSSTRTCASPDAAQGVTWGRKCARDW